MPGLHYKNGIRQNEMFSFSVIFIAKHRTNNILVWTLRSVKMQHTYICTLLNIIRHASNGLVCPSHTRAILGGGLGPGGGNDVGVDAHEDAFHRKLRQLHARGTKQVGDGL